MGKKILTVIQAVCDRCGAEGDTGRAPGVAEWGELNVTYKGDFGSRSHMGDVAGQTLNNEVWLCLSCSKAFLRFLRMET